MLFNKTRRLCRRHERSPRAASGIVEDARRREGKTGEKDYKYNPSTERYPLLLLLATRDHFIRSF